MPDRPALHADAGLELFEGPPLLVPHGDPQVLKAQCRVGNGIPARRAGPIGPCRDQAGFEASWTRTNMCHKSLLKIAGLNWGSIFVSH